MVSNKINSNLKFIFFIEANPKAYMTIYYYCYYYYYYYYYYFIYFTLFWFLRIQWWLYRYFRSVYFFAEQ